MWARWLSLSLSCPLTSNSLVLCLNAGTVPTPGELAVSGVRVTGSGDGDLADAADQLTRLGDVGGKETSPLVHLGPGLPAMPKKLVDRIEANEYVDFNDLPPAKGKGRLLSQPLEGQLVVIQAADLVQSRRLIPDLATWVQCFGIYTAVVTQKKPDKLPELLAYQATVAKASQKYRWPSWLIYDQNFRMEAAGKPETSWAQMDPGLYTQCFTGQARTAENWCTTCQGVDHPSTRCPFRTHKRSWSSAFGSQGSQKAARSPNPNPAGRLGVCIKYNRFNGDCRYGKKVSLLSRVRVLWW